MSNLQKVEGTSHYVGGLVGYSFGPIKNCSVKGNAQSSLIVSQSYALGGIVGTAVGTLENCTVDGFLAIKSLSNGIAVGGIAGSAGINTTNCHISNVGTISGTVDVGGVAGAAYDINCSVINCSVFNVNSILGEVYIGGAFGTVGPMAGCTVDEVYLVEATTWGVGGLAGNAISTVLNSYSNVSIIRGNRGPNSVD